MPVELEWLGVDQAGRVGLFFDWDPDDDLLAAVERTFEPDELGQLGLPWYQYEHECGDTAYVLVETGTLMEADLPEDLVARAGLVRLPVEFAGELIPLWQLLGHEPPVRPTYSWRGFVARLRSAAGTRMWPPRAKGVEDCSHVFLNGRLAITMHL